MENTREQRNRARWFWYLCRFGIVAVFVAAAVPKFFNVNLFRVTIQAYYGFLPNNLALAIALVFPWLELGLALILLVLERWQKQASFGLLLFSAYFFVQSILFYNQWMPYGCGCFGFGEAEVLGYDGIIRNGAILLLAFLAFWGCFKGYALWEGRKKQESEPAAEPVAEVSVDLPTENLEVSEEPAPVPPPAESAPADTTEQPTEPEVVAAVAAVTKLQEQADREAAAPELSCGEVVEAIELEMAVEPPVIAAPVTPQGVPERLGGTGARRPSHRWATSNPVDSNAADEPAVPEEPAPQPPTALPAEAVPALHLERPHKQSAPVEEQPPATAPVEEPTPAAEPEQAVPAAPKAPADHQPKQVVAKRKRGKKAPRHHTLSDDK